MIDLHEMSTKVVRVIESCKTAEQLETAIKYVTLFFGLLDSSNKHHAFIIEVIELVVADKIVNLISKEAQLCHLQSIRS